MACDEATRTASVFAWRDWRRSRKSCQGIRLCSRESKSEPFEYEGASAVRLLHFVVTLVIGQCVIFSVLM